MYTHALLYMDCYGLAVELDASAEEKEIIDLTRRLVSVIGTKDFKEYS